MEEFSIFLKPLEPFHFVKTLSLGRTWLS